MIYKYSMFVNESIDDDKLSNKLIEICNKETITEEDIKQIEELLNDGADLHAEEDESLIASCYNGHTEIVKILLDRGANIDGQQGEPLKWAVENNKIQTVKLMLDRGADVNFGNGYCLRTSARKGNIEILKLLVEKGSDIRYNYNQVLRIACSKNNINMVTFLSKLYSYSELEKFITMYDYEITDRIKKILKRPNYNRQPKLVYESLRDKLVGPTEDEVLDNFKDLTPDKLLVKSCKINFLKGVEVSLERGADIHIDGDYPLVYCCIFNYIDIAKFLLEKGANVHVRDDDPLKRATHNKNWEIVELLKKYMNK